jgi:tetratricopeptide (TPR) repeat protein
MTTPRLILPTLLVLAELFSAGCTKQIREHHALSGAKSDFEAERYDQAEAECHKALQIDPHDAAAIRQLGLIFFAEGRMGEALELLNKAAAAEPQNADLQAKYALAELSTGKRAEARTRAQAVLGLQPGNEDAVLLLSETSTTPALILESRQIIQKFAAAKDQASYHVGLAMLHLLEHDAVQAESELKRALALDPKSSAANFEMAAIDLVHKDEKSAGLHLKIAADLAPIRSSRRLRYIEFELHLKQTVAAKADLAEINRQAPDYIPAWVLGMKLAYSEQRFDDAIAMADQILRRDRYNFEGLSELGTLKLEKGDVDGAIYVLKHADQVFTHSPTVLYALAVAYNKKGDTANAENCLNQAVLVAPNFDQASLLLADLEIGKGELASATGRLTALIKAHPKNGRAYLLLARAYHAEKKPDQALAVYRLAGKEFPKDPQVPYRIGALLNEMNRRPEAQQEFAQALVLAPTYTPALEMLVDSDIKERNFAGAEARVDAVLAQYPKLVPAYVLRAKIHLARRQLGAAETDLLQATALDPTAQAAYLLLSRIYMASDKPQQAVDKLAVLADKNHSESALLQLGLLQTELKHYPEAKTAYERLLKVNPRSIPALNNLAYLYLENLGNIDQAQKIAQQALDLAPDNPSSIDTMGWVLYRRGQFHDAQSLLQRAAEASPADAEIAYHLGAANYMLGAEEPARLALHQATNGAAEFAGKDEARRELAILSIDPAVASAAEKADLEKWAHAHPKDPIAASRLAAFEAHSGSATTAAASYEASLKLNPLDTKTMLDLAEIYAGPLKNPARARELAKSAHELAPDNTQITTALGQILYLTGDYAWSLTLLQEATRDHASPPATTFALARSYYAVGKVTEAQSALQDLLGNPAPFPERAAAEHFSALVLAAQGPDQAKAALADAEKTLESDPTSIPALMIVARTREQAGDYPAAARGYEKILADDAAFGPAARQLAPLYLEKLHNNDKAYAVATAAQASFPDDPDLAKTLGIVAYRRGDFAGAVSALAKCLASRPDDTGAVYYSGMAHTQLKDRGTALTELEHALDLNLAGPDADQAKRTITQIQAAIKAESADSAN